MLAIVTLVFETRAVVFFFWNRTRIWTVFAGLMMHIAIAILMKDLIYFSVQMMMAYVFFIPESGLYGSVIGAGIWFTIQASVEICRVRLHSAVRRAHRAHRI